MSIDYNQIEKEAKCKDIPDGLRLMTGSYEVNQFLDNVGIKHDPDSIVLEDSYNCVFEGYNNGNYEIWVMHKSVPYLNADAFKIDLDTCNQYYLSEIIG